MDRIKAVNDLGQSIWVDSISREMIRSGELQRLIDIGISGVTSNPTIFAKAMSQGDSYDEALALLAAEGRNASQIFEALAVDDITEAADALRPVYDAAGGADGFVSIEVSPTLARDTDGSVEEARRLFEAIDRPNVMVKIPGTPEGMPAIRQLISEGINVNVTLLFAISAYKEAAWAYIKGLRDQQDGNSLGRVRSVASFFVSRVDTAIDGRLDALDGANLADLKGRAAIANARLAYFQFQQIFGGRDFTELAQHGALTQRPLWGSTSTKNPEYPDTLYVDHLIGPHTVNTMPLETLAAFIDHGRPEARLARNIEDAHTLFEELRRLGIDIDQVTDELLEAGIKAFTDSYHEVLDVIEGKRARLKRTLALRGRCGPEALAGRVSQQLNQMQSDHLVRRVWDRDPTVWVEPSPGGAAPSERLGWLDLPDTLASTVREAEAFTVDVRGAGYRDIVLLGMGGSSMAPEVMRAVFGAGPGLPDLHVLDTTVPAQILRVEEAIDPRTTLFVVSSKSGTTAEPLSLYRRFLNLVESAGAGRPGLNFIAITDPGSPLEKIARDAGFRRVFLAPPDVGGRYSALSAFGIVPAALIGIDVRRVAESAVEMAKCCRLVEPLNPGIWLGAHLGAMAAAGRDKLTLIISPELSRLGLWIEQLIAESTGKRGRGIIPVDGEGYHEPSRYGDDRLFVYLRLQRGANKATDAHAAAQEQAGHPVVRLDLPDRLAIGGELFRWQFATAAAANIIGVNPFDEPDVDLAKDKARAALAGGADTGGVSTADAAAALQGLLSQRMPADYLAIAAYLPETEAFTKAVADLRHAVTATTGLPTTFGYGPRYLHSTGQLHKGGPDSVMLFCLTGADHPALPIPGESHGFEGFVAAQAAGDMQALQELGRRNASAVLSGDYVTAVRSLADGMR